MILIKVSQRQLIDYLKISYNYRIIDKLCLNLNSLNSFKINFQIFCLILFFAKTKTMPELHELVDTYHPDVIFSDGDWVAMKALLRALLSQMTAGVQESVVNTGTFYRAMIGIIRRLYKSINGRTP